MAILAKFIMNGLKTSVSLTHALCMKILKDFILKSNLAGFKIEYIKTK